MARRAIHMGADAMILLIEGDASGSSTLQNGRIEMPEEHKAYWRVRVRRVNKGKRDRGQVLTNGEPNE
jgi:hypothetical protein